MEINTGKEKNEHMKNGKHSQLSFLFLRLRLCLIPIPIVYLTVLIPVCPTNLRQLLAEILVLQLSQTMFLVSQRQHDLSQNDVCEAA